jgi:diguanylate cyclase (GGDEF)-like protein
LEEPAHALEQQAEGNESRDEAGEVTVVIARAFPCHGADCMEKRPKANGKSAKPYPASLRFAGSGVRIFVGTQGGAVAELPLDAAPDYRQEGLEIEVKLLRGLALGNKRSAEIQLLLDSQSQGQPDYQALALLVADVSVPEGRAKATFERLRQHRTRMSAALGRLIGIKSAALDYLEHIERALGLRDDDHQLTYAQLAQMAFQDQLSGLANYRYFTHRFSEEVKRAGRYHHLLSLLMLDLDFFKQFNDTHGHLAGNKAIEHLAGILRLGARETDLVARYGGEEFAIILPETAKHEAETVGDRIRANLEKTPVALPDGAMQTITVSAGLATFPRDAHDAESLLQNADQALYAAKAAGRNRLCVFTPTTVARFHYTPGSLAAAQSIAVAGDFNGWSKDEDVMQRDPEGGFSLALNLAPGRYAYKFVINGEWYIADPQAAQYAHDGYGGRNSVVVVQ